MTISNPLFKKVKLLKISTLYFLFLLVNLSCSSEKKGCTLKEMNDKLIDKGRFSEAASVQIEKLIKWKYEIKISAINLEGKERESVDSLIEQYDLKIKELDEDISNRDKEYKNLLKYCGTKN